MHENFLKEFAFFNRLLTLNLPEIFNMLKVFILHNEAPDIAVITKTKPHLLSFTYRLHIWSGLYEQYNTNILTQIFGSGISSIYVESLVMRIWFTSGIFGVFLILFLIRKLQLYQIVFFAITGFTLDIFVSFKIFLMALILNKKINKSNDIRN